MPEWVSPEEFKDMSINKNFNNEKQCEYFCLYSFMIKSCSNNGTGKVMDKLFLMFLGKIR